MAVTDVDKVDLVSKGDDGSLVLIVTDHLNWDDSISHQRTLQDKIGCYLRFVESGQMIRNFPEAAGQEVVIRAVAMSYPDEAGAQFIGRLAGALRQARIGFESRQLD